MIKSLKSSVFLQIFVVIPLFIHNQGHRIRFRQQNYPTRPFWKDNGNKMYDYAKRYLQIATNDLIATVWRNLWDCELGRSHVHWCYGQWARHLGCRCDLQCRFGLPIWEKSKMFRAELCVNSNVHCTFTLYTNSWVFLCVWDITAVLCIALMAEQGITWTIAIQRVIEGWLCRHTVTSSLWNYFFENGLHKIFPYLMSV